MFIISGGRGIGKTKALLTKAYEEGAVVLCKDVEKMYDRARAYGLFNMDIRNYHSMVAITDPDVKVYIHDVNGFFKSYFGDKLKGYSLTYES